MKPFNYTKWRKKLNQIFENRNKIMNEITKTQNSSGHANNTKPTLVAVSKKQEDYKIDMALSCGQLVFGENRVQEALKRWNLRIKQNHNIQLRLIGPLQTNKVKDALNIFNVIETLDREKLAKCIKENYENDSKTDELYIQVNTGNESQKGGINPNNLNEFVNYCKIDLKLPIVGLMCIPPLDEEPAMHFCLLKKLAEKNKLKKLSMGMSNDFKEAIKFGATSVRLGTLFFGPRQN